MSKYLTDQGESDGVKTTVIVDTDRAIAMTTERCSVQYRHCAAIERAGSVIDQHLMTDTEVIHCVLKGQV
jgi:hypothetical protein